jgi:hypothetical protein
LRFLRCAGKKFRRPQTQEVLTLPELLAEALWVHPAIKAEAQMIESKKARVPQVKPLPDPTVGGNGMKRSNRNHGSWNLHLYEEAFDDLCV